MIVNSDVALTWICRLSSLLARIFSEGWCERGKPASWVRSQLQLVSLIM